MKNIIRYSSVILGLCMLLNSMSGLAAAPDPRILDYPDTVLLNGNIVSMADTGVNENTGPSYQAMAIRDHRILALGTTDDIRNLAGPHTAVYDLKGRTVIPGIIDTHTHLWNYAQEHWGPPRRNEYTIKADAGDKWPDIARKTLKLVAGLKGKLKPREWVIVNWPRRLNGIQSDVAIRNQRVLTRQMLDKANAEQRIVLVGNRGVLNTPAMETYGSFFNGKDYPDMYPKDGIVLSATVDRLIFAEELYDLKTQIAMIGQEIKEWTAYGLTTWSSVVDSFSQLAAVMALDDQGRLATRMAYGPGPSFYITMKHNPYLKYDFHGYGTDHLWFNAWSTSSNDGAYPLLATTIEARPEIKERELMRDRIKYTKDYAEMGLRFGDVHIAGDRTLGVTMDMLEAGSKAAGLTLDDIRAKRHAADHCRLNPRPEQVPRLAKLGMIMSCAPKYIVSDGKRVGKDYGKRYLSWVVPFRSLIEGGVRTVFESDTHAVAGAGYFYYIGQMVNRETPDGKIIGPSQRINRIWALKTATTWAPYYLFKEKVMGSLEKGKFADLLVLNKDYFDKKAVPNEMIKTVRPLLTLVGGKVEYLDTAFASELGVRPVGIQPEQLEQQIAAWEAGARNDVDTTSNTDQ